MTGDADIHVDVLLRRESRTVFGEIRSDDGARETYMGWIGLLAALQELMGHDAHPDERQER